MSPCIDPERSRTASRTRPATRCAPSTRRARSASRITGRRCTCTAASRRGSATARRTSGSPRPTENTHWPQGVSVGNVPDMDVLHADDDGCMTFYYTNQQSARLMFYHDHAWGITRLNVYAGEAAGYLISDDTEKRLMQSPAATGPLAQRRSRHPAGRPGQDLRAARHADVQRGHQR